MYSLPNILTISRIVVIPVIFLSIYIHSTLWAVLTAILFIVAAITDYFDGYLARSRNETSAFGRLLDPIADKLSQMAIVIILIIKFWNNDGIVKYIFFLFIFKELVMIIGGGILLSKGMRPTAAEVWGKAATVVFYVFMITIIALGSPDSPLVGVWFFKQLPQTLTTVMVIISALLAFVSLFGYAPGFIKQMKENKAASNSDNKKIN